MGLTLLAWAHRLAFLVSNRDRDWPFTIFYEGDAETFYRYARALLSGELYDGGIPFHPPGFACLLAGLHTILGAGTDGAKVPFFAEKAALALVGSVSIGLLYAVARPYVGRLAALFGALLSLYSFGLYVIHVAPVTEGTWATLLLLALWIWTRRLEHPLAAPGTVNGTWRTGLGLGLLLGFLALVRAEGMLVAALLVGVGFLGVWKVRRSGQAAPIGPWAYGTSPAALPAPVARWTSSSPTAREPSGSPRRSRCSASASASRRRVARAAGRSSSSCSPEWASSPPVSSSATSARACSTCRSGTS